jgi:hypothetical protein
MRFNPDCTDIFNEDEAEATGALCYDAGVSVNMKYASDGSGVLVRDSKAALTNTFQYRNAVVGYKSSGIDISPGLIGMVNPNLDAQSPVFLGLTGPGPGHAVVCDGYGYESLTLYHHLNMGWEGSDDAWYNLPNIDSSHAYNCVDECLYNIRTTGGGDGEVISGLVYTHLGSFPVLIPNASVYVTTEPPTPLSLRGLNFQSSPSAVFTITDSAGIYAFSDLNSNTRYWVTAVARGFTYLSQDVMTGTSQDNQPTSGNVWGVNFELTRPNRFYVDDDAPGDPGPGNLMVSDPMENGNI